MHFSKVARKKPAEVRLHVWVEVAVGVAEDDDSLRPRSVLVTNYTPNPNVAAECQHRLRIVEGKVELGGRQYARKFDRHGVEFRAQVAAHQNVRAIAVVERQRGAQTKSAQNGVVYCLCAAKRHVRVGSQVALPRAPCGAQLVGRIEQVGASAKQAKHGAHLAIADRFRELVWVDGKFVRNNEANGLYPCPLRRLLLSREQAEPTLFPAVSKRIGPLVLRQKIIRAVGDEESPVLTYGGVEACGSTVP